MKENNIALCTFLCLAILLTGCVEKKSTLFAEGQRRGGVSPVLREVSGLVASVANPNYLWALNDGGNPAEIFLLNDKAAVVMVCRLAETENRDWEGIAIGPGPVKGKNYLYIGDIGDNEAEYALKYIYRIVEPLLTDKNNIVLVDVEQLVIKLPDGKRDTEAMMVDHQSGALYLISKREKKVNVYRLPGDTPPTKILIPDVVATLPYMNTVAADLSFDGSEFLLKTYSEVLYWKKKPGDKFEEMLMRTPTQLAYNAEPQGETVAWAHDGSGFFTLSESTSGKKAPLYFYRRN